MKDKGKQLVGRRAVLAGAGVAAVAGLAAKAGTASAQNPASRARFEPVRHAGDVWLDELAGGHRVFIDSSTMPGGANALRYANNIMSAHAEEYPGEAADFAMLVCFRHGSTPYGFDDGIWEKYGAMLDRSADPAPTRNPMNTATPANGQNSIASLGAEGVRFVVCNRATRMLAVRLAQSTGATADAVYEELVAGLIPNGRIVAAGVLAATRAQEYGYSLLYSE